MAEPLHPDHPEMRQARYLAHVQDELSYVIECLAQDYTSEARHELSGLLAAVAEAQALLPDCRTTLERVLGTALDALQGESRSRQACIDLVGLRRRIYNTRRLAYGHALKYHGCPPLG